MKKFWVCAYLVIGIIVGVGISLFMNKKTCIKTEKIKAGFSITHELLIDHGLIHSLMFQKKASFLQNKTDTSINKLIENETSKIKK